MPSFFIDRPIFAWVVALFICLIGAISIPLLAVAQYPIIAPPSISISTSYPGASPENLYNSVTRLIEEELNGASGILNFESTSDSLGQVEIIANFVPGTETGAASVEVQNRLKRVEARLPRAVIQQGILVEEASSAVLQIITLRSTDGSLDEVGLGDFMIRNVLGEVRRIPGVGRATLYSTERSLRIWIEPARLVGFGLTADDVTKAITAQNAQVASGSVGAEPSTPEQKISALVLVRGQLSSPDEFGAITLRANPDGSTVRLRDVARIEIGGLSYQFNTRLNGNSTAGLSVLLSPTGNALATASAVEAKMKELSKFFPANIGYEIPYNITPVVKASINKVLMTLVEAVVLVFIVMFLFLQNIRYTIIPTIVVPVALLGTCAMLMAAGYSINMLTMFGMVLAVGILVDDAIVVVENVERIMAEEGLPPKEATRKAMSQITGAIIGITLVLTAVFIPMAFFSGSVGTIYRQFSLSLVSSMLFSVLLAMSLTPALCATLLKPIPQGHKHEKRGFFGWFNRAFAKSTTRYQSSVGRILHHNPISMVVYVLVIGRVCVLYVNLPSSFLPAEDQGYFITNIQLPVGATKERTDAVLRQVEDYFLKQPEIESFITVAGFSFNGRGQNSALSFGRLKDWNTRKGAEHTVQAVIARAAAKFSSIKDAIIFPLNPPAINELGNSTGFDLELQDLAGLGHETLLAARNQLLEMAANNPVVVGVRVQGLEDAAQLKIDLDEEKANALGVSPADINTTLQTAFGSTYVNNFINGNRVQRVLVQLDAPFRMSPDDVRNVYVRNRTGTMVPLAEFTTVKWIYGSPQLQHYNGFPSYEIIGAAASGKSTGEAMNAREAMAKQLPAGIGYEWTGQSYEERLSGSQAPMLYTLSLLVGFLCLAALYESWPIPLSVILVVPLGVLGALLATKLRGLPNDVYFKVGLLTIVGLATKNAILIIEYAKDLQAEGKGLLEAVLEAVHLRLRPILMTSFAFILGVMPLALSVGAGSASRNAIGTGVAGGMFAATALGLFLIPVFYVVVRSIFKAKVKHAPTRELGTDISGGSKEPIV